MKRNLALIVIIFCSALLTQGIALAQSANNACGPEKTSFKVTTTDNTTIPAPQPGMAILVFIEDQLQDRPGHTGCLKCSALVRLGMGGQWIAATSGFSRAVVSVPSGDQHFCAMAGAYTFEKTPLPSHYALHVEAGQTYFLRARILPFSDYGISVLDLTRINDDEGHYLTTITKLSTFAAK